MNEPQRIQRRRTKGWQMPEGAIYVGRPTIFGNPFEIYRAECCGYWDVRDDNGITYLIDHRVTDCSERRWADCKLDAAKLSVSLFHDDLVTWFGGRLANEPGLREALESLRGNDLACWCPLDQPCHADVLLEIANGGQR